MRTNIIILLFFVVLILPVVNAETVTYAVPSGKAIEILTIVSQPGTTATVSLLQGSGDRISGTWQYGNYEFLPWPHINAEMSLGSDSGSFSYTLPGTLTITLWPIGNVTASNRVRMGMGQSAVYYNKVIETPMNASPIIGYTIISDKPVSADVVLVSYSAMEKALSPTESIDDILTKIKGYWDMAWGIFTALAYWLKFLFFDNLILLVVLYFMGTMAYAANSSRNIFVFYKTWFRQQVALMHFIANIYSITISIITQIAQSLKLI